MSARLPNFVFSIPDFKPGPRLVFKSLCWHFNDRDKDRYGMCCPTQQTIAEETGYTRQHIGDEITPKLEEMGRVVATPMPGWVHRYSYDLFFSVDELVRFGLSEEYVLGRIKELVERESEEEEIDDGEITPDSPQKSSPTHQHLTPDPRLLARLESKRLISKEVGGKADRLEDRRWNIRHIDITNARKSDNGMPELLTMGMPENPVMECREFRHKQ